MRRLGRCFPIRRNFDAVPLGTISSVSFTVHPKRALNLINRSNYKGAAMNHALLHLCRPATNGVAFSKGILFSDKRRCSRGKGVVISTGKGPIVNGGMSIGVVPCHGRVRVMFRSPCSSLGPHVAIRSVVKRPLSIRGLCEGEGRHHRGVLSLVRLINLGTRRTVHCTRRFSNKRHRHVKVTHTLTMGPGFVIYSRTMSTLSISVRTRIIGVFRRLRRGLKITCLFVTRSLLIMRRVSSQVTIVCLKGVVRVTSTSRLGTGPVRPCALDLLSTIPVPSPRATEGDREVILRKSIPDPLGVPAKYPFHAEYGCTARGYNRRVPRLASEKGNRVITY